MPRRLTCIVTVLSSTNTSFVRLLIKGQRYDKAMVNAYTNKSAPIVALYWLLKRLFTYWFMSEVFPTLNAKVSTPHPASQTQSIPSTRCRPE